MQTQLAVLVILLTLVGSSQAQGERHELGRRLRQFEQLWEHERDTVKRTIASQRMNEAVLSFFAFKLQAAGAALDQGMLELQGKHNESPSKELRSLWMQTSSQWLDNSTRQISVKLDRFYPTKDGVIKNVMVLCEWTSFESRRIAHTRPEPHFYPIPGEIILAVPGKEGDHFLKAIVRNGPETLTSELFAISITHDRDRRLNAIREVIRTWAKPPSTIDELSIIHHEKLLSKLAQGDAVETDYPAHALLRQCEEIIAQRGKNQPYFASGKEGQLWLNVPTKSKGVMTVRMQPGQAAPGKKTPVLLALHGAGGSENLFFDGYGNGKIGRLAELNGWFVVAPRNSISQAGHVETIAELAKVFPEMDVKNIYVIGHSMGGSEAMREANTAPGSYGAVAVLGGGGTVRPAKGQEKAYIALPFFVGAGEFDFAKDRAEALAKKLKDLGVNTVQYRKYDGIEHMLIVQEALPDVFRFFVEEHKKRLVVQARSEP